MKLLLFFLFSVLCTACGGGGGDGPLQTPSPTLTPTPTVSVTPTPDPVVISGVAHDARVFDSTIRAHSLNDSFSINQLLDSDTSSNIGGFNIEIQGQASQPLRISVDGGTYVEEASGEFVSLGDNDDFYTYINFDHTQDQNIAITPLSYWSACYAEYLYSQGSTVGMAISNAVSYFNSFAGFPIQLTAPIDISDPTPLAVGSDVLSGFLFAAVSGLTAEIARENGQPPHQISTYTSNNFIQLGCQDIRLDGLLDGQASGQLAIGTVLLDQSYYRELIARHVLLMVDSDANATNIGIDDLMTFANNWSQSSDGVFGGVAGVPVDIYGPEISTSFDNSGPLAGEITIPISLSDSSDIASIEGMVNGEEVVISEIATNFSVTLDTSSYLDGDYTLSLVITDEWGNVSDFSLSLSFFNTASTLTLSSELITGEADYTLSGEFESAGVAIDRIEVNGELATIDDSYWSFATTLTNGANVFDVVIYDEIGNSNEYEFTVGRDGLAPQISSRLVTVRIGNVEGMAYNLCGLSDYRTSSSNALCLLESKTTLGGQAVTSTLSGQDIWSVGLGFNDWENQPYHTAVEDLVVEYRYSRETTGVVVDWAPSPIVGFGQNTTYVPITIEYLSDDFYITTIDEVHTITIRVTDSVGNNIQQDFTFRLNMIDG